MIFNLEFRSDYIWVGLGHAECTKKEGTNQEGRKEGGEEVLFDTCLDYVLCYVYWGGVLGGSLPFFFFFFFTPAQYE